MSKTAVLVCLTLGASASASAFLLTPALTVGALAPLAACDQFPADDAAASSSSSSTGGVVSDTAADGGVVRQSLDAPTLCTRMINQCGEAIVLADCIKSYASLRVAPSCTTALASATCDDLSNTASGPFTTCFPACSGTLAACNGDGTLSMCTPDGQSQVVDCHDYCIAQGYTSWTGTCDVSYQGQTSASPQCWCQ